MSEKLETVTEDDEVAEERVLLFDPFERHFVSGNKRDEFLKALEKGQHETTYSAIH